MDMLLDMAKEMGEAIQQDDRFVALQMAQAKADEDAALQDLIGEFNLKRMALANEDEKEEDRDAEKVAKLDTELREVYARVMANDSMKAYNDARTAMDSLLSNINRILALSAQGQDPQSIEEEHSCNGHCGSCGGCH